MVGYKIVDYDGSKAYSKADSRLQYPLHKGAVYLTPELWLGTTKQYVIDYYYGDGEDPEDPDELLLTIEYDPADVIKGDPSSASVRGDEFAVRKGVLISAESLKTGRKIVASLVGVSDLLRVVSRDIPKETASETQ